MITPNKVVTLQDSALGLATTILSLGPNPTSLANLYEQVSKHFDSIDQFLVTIDLLFVLGRVNVDLDGGVLTYAV